MSQISVHSGKDDRLLLHSTLLSGSSSNGVDGVFQKFSKHSQKLLHNVSFQPLTYKSSTEANVFYMIELLQTTKLEKSHVLGFHHCPKGKTKNVITCFIFLKFLFNK